jgi:hypothetical protein
VAARIKDGLITLLIFASMLLMVNAPSIGVGYGFITASMTIAVVVLEPVAAALATLLGGLAALPLIYASRSMLVTVAVLNVVLRPVVSYVSSKVRLMRGDAAGVLTLSLLTPIIATTAGILYYGDDGVHSSLSIYDAVTVFLTLAALEAFRRSRLLGLLGFTGVVVYIAGLLYFPSIAAAFGAFTALLAPLAAARGLERASSIVMLAVLAIGLALGAAPLLANLKTAAYPLEPRSYTNERWTLSSLCAGRLNAFDGVHDPARLRIVNDCVTVEGVVKGIPFTADDGDFCFDLEVENSTASPLLSTGNIILRKDALHVEIIPRDRGILAGLGGKVCRGDRLVVTGVHVVDTDHGQWAEIHPAIRVELLSRGEGPCVALVEAGG